MTRLIYNKLIRNRIPEIIQSEGRTYGIDNLSEEAFGLALRAKLVEEAQEVSSANPDKLIAEVADLYEVIDALLALQGIDKDTVIAMQRRRHTERGGFDKRLRLLWTE